MKKVLVTVISATMAGMMTMPLMPVMPVAAAGAGTVSYTGVTTDVNDGKEYRTITVYCDGSATYKLEAEGRDSDFDGNYYFAQYLGADVKAGLRSLIRTGNVGVNGYTVPSSAQILAEVAANGAYSYEINGQTAATMTSADDIEAFTDKILDAIGDLFKKAGTQVIIMQNEDGSTAAVEIVYTEGALIDHVTQNADGTVTAYTDQTTAFGITKGMGPEAVTEPVVFAKENVTGIIPGCIAVYWKAPDGWHLQAAQARKGKLIGGADHEYYVLQYADGTTVQYEDAAMFSRGFADGNRPGQFTNTTNRLGLNDIEVTVWFIPGTADSANPMPIGITSLDHADERLSAAIDKVQQVIDNTVIASTQEEAAAAAAERGLADYDWVKPEDTLEHTSDVTGKVSPGIVQMVQEELAAARTTLADPDSSAADKDNAAYDLYIGLYGSSSDIGAVFSGTAKEGFYDVADNGAKRLEPAVLK